MMLWKLFGWKSKSIKNVTVLICNVYHPPKALVGWMEDFSSMMEKAAGEKMDRFVLGDFNCDLQKLVSDTTKLEEIALEHGLAQVVSATSTQPTFLGLMLSE